MAAACPRLSVCLLVPGSCMRCSGPCSPLAVHPWREGRAASASWHGADVEPCRGQGTSPALWPGRGTHGAAAGCPSGVRSGGAAWVGVGVSLPRVGSSHSSVGMR